MIRTSAGPIIAIVEGADRSQSMRRAVRDALQSINRATSVYHIVTESQLRGEKLTVPSGIGHPYVVVYTPTDRPNSPPMMTYSTFPGGVRTILRAAFKHAPSHRQTPAPSPPASPPASRPVSPPRASPPASRPASRPRPTADNLVRRYGFNTNSLIQNAARSGLGLNNLGTVLNAKHNIVLSRRRPNNLNVHTAYGLAKAGLKRADQLRTMSIDKSAVNALAAEVRAVSRPNAATPPVVVKGSRFATLKSALAFVVLVFQVAQYLMKTLENPYVQYAVQTMFLYGRSRVPSGWTNVLKIFNVAEYTASYAIVKHGLSKNNRTVDPPQTVPNAAMAGVTGAKDYFTDLAGRDPTTVAFNTLVTGPTATFVRAATAKSVIAVMNWFRKVQKASSATVTTFVRNLVLGSSIDPETKSILSAIVHMDSKGMQSIPNLGPYIEKMNAEERGLFDLVGAIKIANARKQGRVKELAFFERAFHWKP